MGLVDIIFLSFNFQCINVTVEDILRFPAQPAIVNGCVLCKLKFDVNLCIHSSNNGS